jgi:hypothetical protein
LVDVVKVNIPAYVPLPAVAAGESRSIPVTVKPMLVVGALAQATLGFAVKLAFAVSPDTEFDVNTT